ncbi:hypothetical protein C1637_03480 [Chryseobacterium lactis]|uniref:DUF3244 domain-containing protein n=1 Tax=Chryseobacterium lactis TaxID=1241981 RepID=A0A3G6RP03_CHRLC|nr:hypothetical protein [Chryseobacterium lactis]AZA81647.1 hypothetical protein EG342_06875 [Chryseobacterium lactis]AZB06645.1 hypothetical protein EG341_22995 [Chryseobacterium lactis]PNW15496.1 hypothetical protein C1637_03480 [Chryseobacterium lactis]
MMKLLLCSLVFCALSSCTWTRGKHTYENAWNVPSQASVAINSTSKDKFPMVLYNRSKENIPLKVVIKDDSYSKVINRNDSLTITAHMNKGIVVSNTGKGEGVFRIKVYNHNGSIKENRLR